MSEQDLIYFLKNLNKGDDKVFCRITAEKELLTFIAHHGYSELAEAYEEASRRVPFWYE